MKFKIQKERLAKEILVFWVILVPILLVYVYIILNNFNYTQKISSQKVAIQEFYKSAADLNNLVDISIESFENKIDSLKEEKNRLQFFQLKYPELKYFTNHLDEKSSDLLFVIGVPSARKGSIVQLRNYWKDYLNNIGVIYNRDKQVYDNIYNISSEGEFVLIINERINEIFDGNIQRDALLKTKLDELQEKIISSGERNRFFKIVILSYLILIYPLRLMVISILWSVKLLKKE